MSGGHPAAKASWDFTHQMAHLRRRQRTRDTRVCVAWSCHNNNTIRWELVMVPCHTADDQRPGEGAGNTIPGPSSRRGGGSEADTAGGGVMVCANTTYHIDN